MLAGNIVPAFVLPTTDGTTVFVLTGIVVGLT